MTSSSRNNEHSSQQQTLQLTKPFLLLVSFLLYLNLSLLGHITFHTNIGDDITSRKKLRYGWFPEVMNLRRSGDDGNNNITVVKQHAVSNEQLPTVEQQQQQQKQQEEQDEEDKNRQWKILLYLNQTFLLKLSLKFLI